MPVPVELLRFFEKMAPGPEAPTGSTALADAEALDLGDAEVADAEAAIAHTGTPELGAAAVPPVPEVPEVPEVPQVGPVAEGAPELPAGDGVGEGEELPSKEVKTAKR
jgi:hypothetical protein